MDTKLYVTAKFAAKEAHISAMIGLLETLTSATKSEAGCLEYGYYQSSDNSKKFISFEIWDTPEAEAAHWDTPHLKAALAQLPNFMDGEAEVTKYQKIA